MREAEVAATSSRDGSEPFEFLRVSRLKPVSTQTACIMNTAEQHQGADFEHPGQTVEFLPEVGFRAIVLPQSGQGYKIRERIGLP